MLTTLFLLAMMMQPSLDEAASGPYPYVVLFSLDGCSFCYTSEHAASSIAVRDILVYRLYKGRDDELIKKYKKTPYYPEVQAHYINKQGKREIIIFKVPIQQDLGIHLAKFLLEFKP